MVITDSTSNLVLTPHALSRKSERDINITKTGDMYYINNKEISITDISKLPYVRDNGCFKYYDYKNFVSWYVRGNKIVTIVKYDKIAIFRRIITDVYHWNFNEFCRDHLFNSCCRGNKCKYKHIDLDLIYNFNICKKC